MSRFLTLALAILTMLAVFTRIPAAATAQLHRDLLWATVQVCVGAQRGVGLPFPCRSVDLDGAGRPGAALLHAPGAATHHVLMPVDDFAGLEGPELQGPDGAALFQTAWAARAAVAGASGRPLSDVGLAINSPMARSQDHMHIHLDCVGRGIRAALRGAKVGDGWDWLPQPIDGRRYLARRAPAGAGLNPFAALAQVLPDRKLIVQASLAVIEGEGGVLYLVADIRPNSMAELLLDHRCAGNGVGR